MRKVSSFLIVVLLSVSLSIPTKSVSACSGTGCRGDDPAIETDDDGFACSATGYTVYGGSSVSGEYGTVYNELRYSRGCESNWSRATVWANNFKTKYLYARVLEVPNPNWAYYYYVQGNPLSVGHSCYTDMVSGTVTTRSFSGISNEAWWGPYDPSHAYEG